jgi:hypothetical protein
MIEIISERGLRMSLEHAQAFVQKTKKFSAMVEKISSREHLWNFIHNKGYDFDECDLLRAMSACMAELEASGKQRR